MKTQTTQPKTPYIRRNNYSEVVEDLSPEITTFIKSYLLNLYQQKISSSEIVVTKMMSCISNVYMMPKPPLALTLERSDIQFFDDMFLFVSVEYKDNAYEINFRKSYEEIQRTSRVVEKNRIYIAGFTPEATLSRNLLTKMRIEAIKHSPVCNSVMVYKSSNFWGTDILTAFERIKPIKTRLSDIYIPDNKRHQIERFIYEVMNYHKNKTPMRYLFSGPPGTGKTNLINAIINETTGKITVILCNSADVPLERLFTFCQIFEPALLVIDDLDFIASDRQMNSQNATLGNLLNLLDGILPKNVFMLATTNSKALIDTAASRPGRFSLIIDLAVLDSKNYLQLIHRETDDEKIISLFDDNTLLDLKSKRITGALLVNLIKQLKSCKSMKGDVTKEDFEQYFDLIYNGFYKSNAENEVKGVGFGN